MLLRSPLPNHPCRYCLNNPQGCIFSSSRRPSLLFRNFVVRLSHQEGLNLLVRIIPGIKGGATKNLGLIGSAVLTFIGIENRIYRVEFTRKKCKTAILLYCFHTAGVLHIFMITFWALEYHFIENLKLLLKETQIMK